VPGNGSECPSAGWRLLSWLAGHHARGATCAFFVLRRAAEWQHGPAFPLRKFRYGERPRRRRHRQTPSHVTLPPRWLVRRSAARHAHLIVESNRIDHPLAYYQQGWPLVFIETRRANNRTTTASEAAVPAPLTQHPPSHPHRIRTPSLAAWRASLGGGGSCRASLPTWVSSRHWPCKYVSASASRVCV